MVTWKAVMNFNLNTEYFHRPLPVSKQKPSKKQTKIVIEVQAILWYQLHPCSQPLELLKLPKTILIFPQLHTLPWFQQTDNFCSQERIFYLIGVILEEKLG